jgi:hypothetical protein
MTTGLNISGINFKNPEEEYVYCVHHVVCSRIYTFLRLRPSNATNKGFNKTLIKYTISVLEGLNFNIS